MKFSAESSKGKKKSLHAFLVELFDWIDAAIVSVICVVLIFTFVFRTVGIEGPSMKDTLYAGERVIISGFNYTPQPGDIVVISRNYTNDESLKDYYSAEPIIKRVIAVGGQTVNINFVSGIVYVDGKALDEPYARTLTTRKKDVEFPLTVEEGHIFVMGDNRDESLDSRSSEIGQVDVRYVLGRAIFRVYPFDRMGLLN